MYQNRVSIIGFVGNDAQVRSTKNGATVAVFSVAVCAICPWHEAASPDSVEELGPSHIIPLV